MQTLQTTEKFSKSCLILWNSHTKAQVEMFDWKLDLQILKFVQTVLSCPHPWAKREANPCDGSDPGKYKDNLLLAKIAPRCRPQLCKSHYS